MMKKNNHTKKKRQQPRPKRKKKPSISSIRNQILKQETYMKFVGKQILDIFRNREEVIAAVNYNINLIEECFRKYDSVQLLGSVGLYLIKNLPNPKNYMLNKRINLDENAEVLAEYALNFGLALQNTNKESPTEDVVNEIRERLKVLFFAYMHLDMPFERDSTQELEWMMHMDTIAVRGDGYQVHVYEVFKELFFPHSDFYIQEYGYNVEQLFNFFMDLEERIICKIALDDSVYSCSKLYDRLMKWEKETYGDLENIEFDTTKGLFGDFFKANPDVPHSEDGERFAVYEKDDYAKSDMIFWVYPQNEVEQRILNSLSMEFGDNTSFLNNDEYKGNIMNGFSIFEKPFVKDGDKFFCFTPMIPHRNLFLIAEKLMKRNDSYYQKYFQQNTNDTSRDVYVEKKVKSVLESFLPDVRFYSSVHYTLSDKIVKNAELDILGVSDNAIYIIEVKAHELSRKDRVGIVGAKSKFKASITEACSQCSRASKYIGTADSPQFGNKEGIVKIDKAKPVYKIVVTFQHYYSLLGQMDKLVESGLMETEYRDTWIVSLFDLMVVSDFVETEGEFLSYLDMHKIINTNHSTFHDELDVFGQFLNNDLLRKVRHNKPARIIGGSEDIDAEYSRDYLWPIEINDLDEYMRK